MTDATSDKEREIREDWIKNKPFIHNSPIEFLFKLLDEERIKLDQEKFSHQNAFNHWQTAADELSRERQVAKLLEDAIAIILAPCDIQQENPFVKMSDGFKGLREALKQASQIREGL
jgi:hypothetical protein